MQNSGLLDQYMKICKDVLSKVETKLSKSFKDFIIETLLLYYGNFSHGKPFHFDTAFSSCIVVRCDAIKKSVRISVLSWQCGHVVGMTTGTVARSFLKYGTGGKWKYLMLKAEGYTLNDGCAYMPGESGILSLLFMVFLHLKMGSDDPGRVAVN